ncbi:nitrous oxide reductase accessory protein NosL [bacterium]|nr:nitrous oxide reductase accessory protein NosL [bacterium]
MTLIAKGTLRAWRFAAGMLLLAGAAALLFWYQPVQALDIRPICETCRRYTDKSPSRVMAYIEIGRHVKRLDACSLFCLVEMLEDQEYEPTFIYVTDYATFDTDEQMPLDALKAWYVYDCETGDEEKSNCPYVYAFASEATAREYQDDLGGEVLDWEDTLARITELTDEWEPEPVGHHHTPLKHPRTKKDDQ